MAEGTISAPIQIMASREHQLLSRIIRTGDVSSIVSWGIQSADFVSSEARAMFDHIVSYHMTFKGSVIGPEAAKQHYPMFQLCDDPSMHTDALCQEVRKNRIAVEGGRRIAEAQNLLTVDPIAAVAQLGAISHDLTSLTTTKNTDVYAGDAFRRIMHKYELQKQGYNFSMCHWPWEPIQDVTGGIMFDDYIIFYGRPKSFKSWQLAYLISWLVNHQKRGLIYTKEMSADDIFKRVLACMAEVDYAAFRLGRLDQYQEQAVYSIQQMMSILEAENSLVCLSGQDCPSGGDTVPWLKSKVDLYKPDFVAIDGMYLMSDAHGAKKDHERVRNISRDCRQMTLSTKTALIATVQANRGASKHNEANLDELAFTDAFGQDATHIFRVINEKDSPTCAIITGGAREFSLNGWRTFAIPATNFGYYGPITNRDIEKAKEKDTGEEGAEAVPPPTQKQMSPGQAAERATLGAINNQFSKHGR